MLRMTMTTTMTTATTMRESKWSMLVSGPVAATPSKRGVQLQQYHHHHHLRIGLRVMAKAWQGKAKKEDRSSRRDLVFLTFAGIACVIRFFHTGRSWVPAQHGPVIWSH